MEHYDLEEFNRDLNVFGVILKDEQMQRFMDYYELLIEWNSFMNLTAITEYKEVLKKHFVDSLSLIKAYPLQDCDIKIIDVGTGAGFPGIPLKIAFPELRITLMDSLNKRVKFLNEVIERLQLKDIEAYHSRAEDLAREQEHRENYDLCVSRAVANLSTLSEYCMPFIKTGGNFISYKAEKVTDEIKSAEGALKILGGKIIKQTEFCLPYSEIYRNLITVEKIKSTPRKYPRKAGLPAKEPLFV